MRNTRNLHRRRQHAGNCGGRSNGFCRSRWTSGFAAGKTAMAEAASHGGCRDGRCRTKARSRKIYLARSRRAVPTHLRRLACVSGISSRANTLHRLAALAITPLFCHKHCATRGRPVHVWAPGSEETSSAESHVHRSSWKFRFRFSRARRRTARPISFSAHPVGAVGSTWLWPPIDEHRLLPLAGKARSSPRRLAAVDGARAFSGIPWHSPECSRRRPSLDGLDFASRGRARVALDPRVGVEVAHVRTLEVAHGLAPDSELNSPHAATPESTRAVREKLGNPRLLLGHLGTYSPVIREMLEPVIVELLRSHPELSFVMLGSGGSEVRSALLAESPDLSSRLLATGFLPSGELSPHLAACDLLIQPYPDGASSRRSSLMAGISHGVPVVTTSGHLSESLWSECRCSRDRSCRRPKCFRECCAKTDQVSGRTRSPGRRGLTALPAEVRLAASGGRSRRCGRTRTSPSHLVAGTSLDNPSTVMRKLKSPQSLARISVVYRCALLLSLTLHGELAALKHTLRRCFLRWRMPATIRRRSSSPMGT